MKAQDTKFNTILKCGKQILDLSEAKIMGILNVTPDSFYDGGSYSTLNKAIIHAKKMISEGVDIIDIGGTSTKPGAKAISEEEELKRVIPVIKKIRKLFPEVIISIDTYRSNVAIKAIDNGCNIINDVSGGSMDSNMFTVVGKLDVPYVLTHIQGTPETMQIDPKYANVVKEVSDFFIIKTKQLKKKGASQIIIDPGFGFGKNIEHNYDLLNNLMQFKKLRYPILVGASRKSMINKVLKTKPENALNGTTVVNTIALLNGANILRVHDVKQAKETVKIVLQLKPNLCSRR